MKFLDGFQNQTYALLRIMAGLMFMAHGVQKFFNFPTEFPYPLNSMTTAAASIEFVGGALIVIGLFTRPVAFIASGMSAVGYWMVHGTNNFFPIANGGEIIALYCFIFLYIAAKGPGIWSVDKD
ncbi:MAG: DoxX family protein [Marinicaulis sp.]|nr:DoxX family protein [Marinicaulis sp.]NNE39414.1 DoxX family protein [Marinicaulis sp.]NNL88785.1 DoxX family protein [Marinicaulis sp.]